jgi:hypothetical protein
MTYHVVLLFSLALPVLPVLSSLESGSWLCFPSFHAWRNENTLARVLRSRTDAARSMLLQYNTTFRLLTVDALGSNPGFFAFWSKL